MFRSCSNKQMTSPEPPIKQLDRGSNAEIAALVGSRPRPFRRVFLFAGVVVAFIVAAACATTSREMKSVDLAAAKERLGRPMTDDPAVLYRLRVPSSSGLRLAVVTSGDQGRLTVSEPFGSAVSLTAWSGSDRPTFFDLRNGCRIEAADLEQALGVPAMPLPQAVRLMCGRLPAVEGDQVAETADGRLLVTGQGWSALVTVAPEPWRVVEVEQAGHDDAGWRLELRDHNVYPRAIRLERKGGRWAELELVGLEWNQTPELPPLPDLPLCVFKDRQ
jgi:hypothetical protein